MHLLLNRSWRIEEKAMSTVCRDVFWESYAQSEAKCIGSFREGGSWGVGT